MTNKQQKMTRELNAIKMAIGQFSGGASIEQIKAAANLDIELRTLQRRLNKLIKEGSVRASGGSHSTKYHLVNTRQEAKEIPNTGTRFLPLTESSKKTLSLTREPLQKRKPVGYNRDFLDLYRPNIDSYLTDDEKKKLADIGKTTRSDQPAGTYAKEILNRLLIDLSWNSSRLEGNTYSLLDTERLIALGEAADNKSATDAQMILNHKDAIEFLVRDAEGIGFNRYTILNLHALLSNNLLPNPMASGRLRTFGVGIHQSVFTPLAVPQQIEEMFNLMLEKAEAIDNPFEQALFIMVQLPYLQPFDDVNKRVSRISANIPLNRKNLAPLSFIDVPSEIYIQAMIAVYELNKTDVLKDLFIWAYERSCARYAALQQSLGEPDPFRMKYRNDIRSLITSIVSGSVPHKEAARLINDRAVTLPPQDQQKFIEAVETELMSLHEGNFARYWISLAEFNRWQEIWANQ
jgi:hypothetical protein